MTSIVDRYKSGETFPDIAEDLGISVEEAMQRYRDEAYDHWDLGWERTVDDGQARFVTGAIDCWADAEPTIHIEEVTESVPLTLTLDDGEVRHLVDASLSPEQARELAKTLEECADIAEGEK